ncbi:MAG TPA: hypothetical protein VF062_08070 [Candidatus Limnocylindrales bacterium]
MNRGEEDRYNPGWGMAFLLRRPAPGARPARARCPVPGGPCPVPGGPCPVPGRPAPGALWPVGGGRA